MAIFDILNKVQMSWNYQSMLKDFNNFNQPHAFFSLGHLINKTVYRQITRSLFVGYMEC